MHHINRNKRIARRQRRGAIVILTLLLLVACFAFVAFTVDIGHITARRAELQNAADAAARAGVRGLLENPSQARTSAKRLATNNQAANKAVGLHSTEDIAFGTWDDGTYTFTVLPAASENDANAIRVTTRLSAKRGNALKLFFAPLLGRSHTEVSATATAMALSNFRGFQPPANGTNLPILPFVMDLGTWNDVKSGTGPDNWSWNEQTGAVEISSDSVKEMNLMPEGNHAPGNRGYLEIGPDGGSNRSLERQIQEGLTQAELDYHGGALDLGDDGMMTLGGDTGVTSSFEAPFQSIVGEVRIIPIFSDFSWTGNNAQYTIVQWVGVRILYVDYSGNPKRIMVQPTNVWISSGGIPETGDEERSYSVYSLPRLVD